MPTSSFSPSLATHVLSTAQKPLCGIPVQLVREPDGRSRWDTLTLPNDHPAAEAARCLRATALTGEYATQKRLLDVLNEREGRDISVAKFEGRQTPAGKTVSMCSWASARALLPVTDWIVLVKVAVGPDGPRQARSPIMTTRAAVESVLGERKVFQGLTPRRLPVESFLTDAQGNGRKDTVSEHGDATRERTDRSRR